MPRTVATAIECKGCGASIEGRNSRAVYCSDKCQRINYQRNWYERNRDLYRDRYIQRTYDLTLADVERLKHKQNYQCAICKTELADISTKNTHIDHCHKTGVVRGILCVNCNTGLGSFNDDLTLLQAAMEYLDA